jgi:hypothetical protein
MLTFICGNYPLVRNASTYLFVQSFIFRFEILSDACAKQNDQHVQVHISNQNQSMQ